MTPEDLAHQLDSLISGEIAESDHEQLQSLLKSDPAARAALRERMDLEAGLRTWAAENVPSASGRDPEESTLRFGRSQRFVLAGSVLGAIAAGLLIVVASWFWLSRGDGGNRDLAVEPPPPGILEGRRATIGRLRQQDDTQWSAAPKLVANRFSTGTFELSAGVARLEFDSGTNLILEAPCQFDVLSTQSAALLAGNLFVDVTEVSAGFTLQTPDARIIDEGTQFAVALDAESTEVHVFDGSVIWIPETAEPKLEDRIEAGQARRYLRSQPTHAHRIPFGQRSFVRRIEAAVQEQAGDAILAYDGFENLAGRIRRDRSGFGWTGGWQAGRGQRGALATIVDAPGDTIFGQDRSGRRMLFLDAADDIRRQLSRPIDLEPGDQLFMSLFAQRVTESPDESGFLRITLEAEPEDRQRLILSFGVSMEGFPFVNSGGTVAQTASRFDDDVYLLVLKLIADERGLAPKLRILRPDETLDLEPSVWTVAPASRSQSRSIRAIRLTTGASAGWNIDELRIGTTWSAVTSATNREP